jgi:hypothetical protein
MTESERRILDKTRAGQTVTPQDICATITSEVELEQDRLGLRARGALDADAAKAVEARRHGLRAAKGVRGYSA